MSIQVKGPPTPAPKSFLVANLPTDVVAGTIAYASNARKASEGAGLGTGSIVFYDGTNWIRPDTGATAVA